MTRRCCGYDILPYGHLSWIVPVVTFFATWFFLFPAFRCSLTVSKSPAGDFEMWYGYWNAESQEYAFALGPEDDSNVCYKYAGGAARELFGAAWKLGKSVGVIGSFTTIPAALFNCVLFWHRFDLSWFWPLIAIHVFNAFMSFMLLVGLRSTLCEAIQCVLARAGYVAIIAGFLWLLAALLLYLVRRKEAGMSSNPNGVDLKDIERDEEELLALPAPEEKRLALPAPGDDQKRKKKPAPASREVPLALPPSETSREHAPKSPRKKSLSTSNRTSATTPESPRPASSTARRNSDSNLKSPRKGSGSPRKATRASVSGGDAERPSTPRRSSASGRSPKKGSATAPTSAGTKKKKKPATRPDDIPEI